MNLCENSTTKRVTFFVFFRGCSVIINATYQRVRQSTAARRTFRLLSSKQTTKPDNTCVRLIPNKTKKREGKNFYCCYFYRQLHVVQKYKRCIQTCWRYGCNTWYCTEAYAETKPIAAKRGFCYGKAVQKNKQLHQRQQFENIHIKCNKKTEKSNIL
jgi:hypothetical protein